MTLPRILHRIYARIRGLPWRACPICKREFGGHERATLALYIAPGNWESVCNRCEDETSLRNWKKICGETIQEQMSSGVIGRLGRIE